MQGAIHEAVLEQPKYQWGGEDFRVGLDCSGFVTHVLSRMGYTHRPRIDGAVGFRQTADWYSKHVFTSDVPAKEWGKYAEVLCAFCWLENGASVYDHIVLPYGHTLVVDASTHPVSPPLPIGLSVAFDQWYSSTIQDDDGYGSDVDYRFKMVVNLWRFLWLTETAITGLTSGDFWGTVPALVNGLLPFLGIENDYTRWRVSYNGLVWIFAVLCGRSYYNTKLECDYLVDKASVLDPLLPPPTPGVFVPAIFMRWALRLAYHGASSQYELGGVWTAYQMCMPPVKSNGLQSGLRIRGREAVADDRYKKRYLTPRFIDEYFMDGDWAGEIGDMHPTRDLAL